MSDDDGDENVVVLRLVPREPEDNPCTLKPEHARLCDHEPVELCPEERALTCRRCGAEVDPFDWISERAVEWERISGWAKHMQRRRNELYAEVQALRVERSRLRQAVKRGSPRPES